MKYGAKITGSVEFNKNDDYSNVVEITGDLYCSGADTKTAFPKLTTVGGYLDCYGADTTASFPKLTTVGGYLDCSGADTTAAFPKLTTVGGYLDCSVTDTTASFPKLTTVGGSLYCRGADTTASFPKLTTVGGNLDCSGAGTKACFPKLTTVGGYLYCRGADTRTAFPKLTTMGGYLDCRGADTKTAFPKLKNQNTGNTKAIKQVQQAFKKQGFLFVDGILSWLKSTRISGNVKIHKIQIVGKLKLSYCIEMDGTYSHGETLKEARESLIYKIGDRDKSDYEGWTVDKKITKKQAIESYRVITGACEHGVRNFVEGIGKTKSHYTVQEIIEMTKGQYGHGEYKNFFNNK